MHELKGWNKKSEGIFFILLANERSQREAYWDFKLNLTLKAQVAPGVALTTDVVHPCHALP